MTPITGPSPLSNDDELIERILSRPEDATFETKRVGDNRRKIETLVAFANTDGGVLALGVEDEDKAADHHRLYGIQENPESVDELRRLIRSRATPPLDAPDAAAPQFTEVGCILRDGTPGSLMLVRVQKSTLVHSVVDGGTFVRLAKSNRQISAAEITQLAMQRGTTSAVNTLADVPFDLLETAYWREYAAQRHLSRPTAEAMRHLGLARIDDANVIRPTRAAVLLFAEDPSGLLQTKCAIRVFHYKGDEIDYRPDTSLVRPPQTVNGPIIAQIKDALDAILQALATGVQTGSFGFEIVQRYPVRVLREAITNAVIHRDYSLSADIHIRIFTNRIEIESPGLFPANVTAANIGTIGSHPRNALLVNHLREFSAPPNLDAGEGVRMMFHTMEEAHLYPPVFLTRPEVPKESVLVTLANEARPSTWDQVEAYLAQHGQIANAQVREILRSDDPVRASRLLKEWVRLGLLVPTNPEEGKRNRAYRKPGGGNGPTLFSDGLGKETEKST